MSLVQEFRSSGWVELRMNRPDRRNALCGALVDQLVDGIRRAEADAHGLVLAANGPVFCAGADLKEGVSLSQDRPSSRLLHALVSSPLFIVAAVNGGAYGAGASLLTACPVVIATQNAKIGFPEVRQGFFPVGVLPYFDTSVPPRRLIELGITGGALECEEAYSHGLFTELVDEADLTERLLTWMERVVANPQVARQAKRYWSARLSEAEFRTRVEALEGLLNGELRDRNLINKSGSGHS